MKSRTIYDWYNALVPTMNLLSEKNIRIWEFHDDQRGYGFNAILDDFFIRVFIAFDIDDNTEYVITKETMTGNILCGKQLDCVETKDANKVFDIINDLIEKKGE